MPEPAQDPASQIVYRGRIVTLRLDEVAGRDGQTRTREVVEHAGGIAIVAIDDREHVLLVRQPRPAVGEALLELPAGLLEPDEDPRAAAHRELQEETGATAERLEPLARFYTSPGFSTEELHVFLAAGLREGQARPEAGEDLDLVRVPLADLLEMLDRGEIRDGKTLVGLLAYLRRRG